MVAYLTLSGFVTVGVGSAAELYRCMAVESFSVLVLDLNLPGENGLSIAAHVRSLANIGIIMVTASVAPEDRVRGLVAGADIYLPKPVELRELAVAAQNLSRRLERAPPSAVAPPMRPTPQGGAHWQFDQAGFTLVATNGKSAHLTAKEVTLLARLTSQCGVAVSRGELLATLGYDSEDPTNRNLDAALRRLRLKVEEQTGEVLPIRTIHSVGYMASMDIHTVQAS